MRLDSLHVQGFRSLRNVAVPLSNPGPASHARDDPAAGRRASKVVQERLGHSTIAITLDTYSHAIPAMQEDAATRGAGIIDKEPDDEEPDASDDTAEEPGDG